MSDPKHENPTDGESDVQASNDGTAGVGEDPSGESSFDTEHAENTEHTEHTEHAEHTEHTEKGGGGR